MEKSIFIRDTGITVVELLERLSQGFSYDQVLNQIPKLNLSDILGTIRFAADTLDQYVTSEDKIEISGEITLIARNKRILNLSKIREKYPRAFEKWSTREDNELMDLFKTGHPISEIAKQLKRKESAIRSRLEKFELIGNKPPGSFS